jgi:hypothetical protein
VNEKETELKDAVENCSQYKEKKDMKPWILEVILTATTILAVIAGVAATSFVKNRRTQYKFGAVKDSMRE